MFRRYTSIILLYALLVFFKGRGTENLLQEGYSILLKAGKSDRYQERNQDLNKALILFYSLEQMHPHSPWVNQAIGDIYFQLNEYPWAILHYQRALKSDVDLPAAVKFLRESEKKLGLPSSSVENPHENKFLYSVSRKISLIYLAIALCFIFSSLAIWVPLRWIRGMAVLNFMGLIFLVSNRLFFYYFEPLEGILIQSTGLYQAPRKNASQLKEIPLPAGIKIKILEIDNDGIWLKINQEGIVGFIPTETVRLL